MPRCRKVLANGKRCKAHAMAGSKFCLFHTPGQKMKRRKKSPAAAADNRIGYDDKGRKKFWRRTTENQIAVRGTKALGAALVARGTVLKNKPDYTVKVTHHKARYNRQGTIMVGAKTQRTIEPTRSDWGRNFQQTDHRMQNRKRKGSARMIKSGRILPLLGYGFMAYNIMGAPANEPGNEFERTYQGATLIAIGETLSHYQSGGYGNPLGSVDYGLGATQGFGFSDIGPTLASKVFG
jgi:hypothetical protein